MLLTHQNHGYPSVRLPVYARNLVATSHPLGAQAGLRMLAQGGNAVDAAVAVGVTLCVATGFLGGGAKYSCHSSKMPNDSAINKMRRLESMW